MIGAADGNAAIKMLDAKPDLIILELELPDLGGTELLQSIRAHIENVRLWYCPAAETKQTRFTHLTWAAMTSERNRSE
jgi:DNA-binding response OmpR family regulator